MPALLLYYPVYSFGVRNKLHNVQIRPFNEPADRFRNIADWYMVTRRVTVGGQAANLTAWASSGINHPPSDRYAEVAEWQTR